MDDIIIKNSKDVFLSDHIRIDERSLALHGVIAEKLLQNPDLLQKGKKILKDGVLKAWNVQLSRNGKI